MEIITREDAKAAGLKYYFTGKTCKSGHAVKRYVSCAGCVECTRKREREYREMNPGRAAERRRAFNEASPERAREYKRANRDKYRALDAKRHAAKLQRVPQWFTPNDHAQFELLALAAAILAEFTGVSWHVDHIYPLQGETVSGLHVAENWQLLNASDNSCKNNKHPDDWAGPTMDWRQHFEPAELEFIR